MAAFLSAPASATTDNPFQHSLVYFPSSHFSLPVSHLWPGPGLSYIQNPNLEDASIGYLTWQAPGEIPRKDTFVSFLQMNCGICGPSLSLPNARFALK